jgi:hypothetical protein
MNPNDILAQQQAYLNQVIQHNQEQMWGFGAIMLALFVIQVWVIYMFYARLRDIGDELRKFRIAFEFAEDRQARASSVATRSADSTSGGNPSATDDRYKPNPH